MDHRWDEATLQDREGRAESNRYGASRIERDPDVERRDELRRAERIRTINQSPWTIGTAFYDQRDTYTRNAEVDASGYGRGPSFHPEEGSYAYPRNTQPNEWEIHASDANLYEKEAWPWLVYKKTTADPYFAHLHEQKRGLASRLRSAIDRLLGRKRVEPRSDARIRADVADALWERRDLDLSDIDFRVAKFELTLEGTVIDLHTKHAVEKIVRQVRGVRHVHNRLKLREDDTSDTGVAFVPAF